MANSNDIKNLAHAQGDTPEELENLKEWWERNGNLVTIVLVVILVVVLGIRRYDGWKANRMATAMTELQQAQSPEELEQLVAKGGPAVPVARLRLAAIHYAERQYELARSVYEDFLAADRSHPLASEAAFGVAQCKEALGDVAAAAEDFAALRKGEGLAAWVVPAATIGEARCLMLQGSDEARDRGKQILDRFLAGLPAPGSVRVTGDRIPDFDGEVIYATINGKDREKALSVPHPVAIISAQGAASDTYTSDFQDGKAVFFTNNIYGDRDLVCELGGMDEGTQCFLHLEQPYLYPTVGGIPPLKLSEAYRTALLERHLAMQAFHAGYADTLVQFLPVRENLLLRREDRTVYHLDDYVRFPTVDEVLVELVPELRVRKGKRRTREIQMLYTDKAGALSYFRDNILVLLDGIAVTDHARLLEYDSTRKGGSLSLRMNDLTQVIDFKGASYPVALTGKHVPAENDRRQTLFWHPAVTLPAGQEMRLEVRTGALPGRYRVVVEGLDGRLGAVRSEAEFEVY